MSLALNDYKNLQNFLHLALKIGFKSVICLVTCKARFNLLNIFLQQLFKITKKIL
jgi:hypothetical protein